MSLGRQLLTVAWFLALAGMARPALAFVDVETAKGSLTLRGAVDASSSYAWNRGPSLLYPESGQGVGTTDLRLLLNGKAGKHFKIDGNFYLNLNAATDLQSFFTIRSNSDYRTDYLEHTWRTGHVSTSLVVDQISMMFIWGPVDMTIGRQPIGLASTFIFTPNDIFHPFAVGAADKTFRPGVDAARVDWRVGQLAKITAMGVMGYGSDNKPSWSESAVLLKGSMNALGVDWSALGGKAAERYLAGLALSGEIKGVGIRCEGNVSFPENAPSQAYAQVSAGVDYKWSNSLFLRVEYYYHGNGTMDASQYLSRLTTQDMSVDQFLGQHYLGFMLGGEVAPPLTLQLTTMVNLTDPSVYFVPAIIYNVASEVDLYIYGGIPVGRLATSDPTTPTAKSEYGLYAYSVAALVRVFF